ncbi:MAG: TIGR00159 family protein [Deltaproteobacteria bacterium]|nr:TIGR00159 family protein [Deltaproteobacteria bacterium]
MADLFTQIRWQDFLDIGLIACGVYWIIQMIRGTRAVQMLTGFVVIVVAYLGSQSLELYTLNWVLDNFLSSALLVIVVLFQNDIRRALTEVGRSSFFAVRERALYGQVLEELVKAAILLAQRRIGALIVLEREVGLNEYVEGGISIDGRVSKELLCSIFSPLSPVHDGAVVIQRGRLAAAGCFLPLTLSPDVSKQLGTRHRAAIGLTEETDAVVVIVSEEEGSVAVAREGRISHNFDADALLGALQPLFTHAVANV